MSRKLRAGRIAGVAVLATLVMTAGAVLPQAVAGQERDEECESWFGPAAWGDLIDARPRLGVWISSDEDGGVRVLNLVGDGPAANAGMMTGDVILSIDGHDLSDPLEAREEQALDPGRSPPENRLSRLVGEVPEGETVVLVVQRNGERLTFEVAPEVVSSESRWRLCAEEIGERLRGLGQSWFDASGGREEMIDRIGELSEQFRDRRWGFELDSAGWMPPRAYRFYTDSLQSGPAWRWGGAPGGGRGAHGLDLVDLNPGLGAYFGTSEGVLVADVVEDSPLRLRPGDVVVAVEGRVVDDIDELHRILGSYENDEEIAFRIYRDGAQTTVTGTIN